MIFNNVKGKNQLDLVRLTDGEIAISGLVGQASIAVYFRPEFDQCWYPWLKFTVINKRAEASYDTRFGLGEPSSKMDSSALNSRPVSVGRFFQVRIEITGALTFQGAKFKAVSMPENEPARVVCN
jgi:hypothetical protein